MSKEQLYIFDTTLRDGAQTQGVDFSIDDKEKISSALDKLGVDYVEGGWPGANPTDTEFFNKDHNFKSTKLTAFGMTKKSEHSAENDPMLSSLINSKSTSVCLFGKSWDFQVDVALGISNEQNLMNISESTKHIVKSGKEFMFDAEHFFDGYKSDADYAIETLRAAERGGARILVLCDTNGGTLTSELGRILDDVTGKISIDFGIHAHNDSGVGVANSLLAVELGAVQVQGTFNGYGERCGNANLSSIIPNLDLKMGKETIGKESVQELMGFSRFLSEIANVYHDHRQPFVGESAFAHKGGAHIDGVMKVAHSFEHIVPDAVGNERRFLVSDQSGGATIVNKLRRFLPNISKSDPLVGTVLERVKILENQGYQFEAAEGSFELLARRVQGVYENKFSLVHFRTINRRGAEEIEDAEAIVKVKINDQVLHTVGSGDGPVNALDRALRNALEDEFPAVRSVHLEDYKVRVLSSGDGTAAKVRVLIESSDGEDSWGTVGVSENVIDASWLALADSLHYKLMKDSIIND